MRTRTVSLVIFSVCLGCSSPPLLAASLGCSTADRQASKSRDATFLVSGPVGGLRESRSVLDPKGGSIGVIRALNRLDESRTAIRLALGDNLGMALRVPNEDPQPSRLESLLTLTAAADVAAIASARGVASQPPGCRDLMSDAYRAFHEDPDPDGAKKLQRVAGQACELQLTTPDAIRLGQLMRGFQQSDLAAENCLRNLRRSSPRRSPAANGLLDGCENDLLVGELSRNFTAIAIGEGDFNRFGEKGDLSPLRRGPFLADNLFVNKRGSQSRLEDKTNKVRIAVDEEEKLQYPHQPIKIEFKDEKVKAGLKWIKLSGRREGWEVHFLFAEKAKEKASEASAAQEEVVPDRVFLTWNDKDGNRRVLQWDWESSVKEKDATVTLTSPIPLLPNRSYSVKIGFRDARYAETSLEVETYDAFTQTVSPSRVGSSIMGDPAIGTPWAADSVPVIQPKGFERQLRVLAVLDRTVDVRRDRSFCEGRDQSEILACDLRFIGMSDAVQYWRNVLGWLLLQERLAALEQLAAGDYCGASPRLLEILQERRDLKSHLPPEERKAWAVIEKKCAADGPFDCALDYRLPLTQAVLEESIPQPALVLIAQTTRERVLEMADKFPDLMMVIGRELPKDAPRQTAGSFGGIQGPILLFPAENGSSLQKLDAKLATASRWRATQADLTETPASGDPPTLLWDFHLPGSEKCCSKSFLETVDRLLGEESRTGKFDADFQAARDHFLEQMRHQMRLDVRAEVSLLKPGSLDLAALEWMWLLRQLAVGKKVMLPSASLADLEPIPGIGDLARDIRIKNIATLQALENFLNNGGRRHAFDWAKHFLKDANGEVPRPYIVPDRLLALLKSRTVLLEDDLEKVTVAGAQFNKAVLAHPEMRRTGIEVKDKKVFLHGLEVGSETPVTVALPARLAQKGGELAELRAAALQRDEIAVNRDGSKASLESTLDRLIHPLQSEPPSVQEYDHRSWWMVSMKKVDFEFRRISARDGFSPLDSDPRTKSVDSRSVAVKPELTVGWFLPPGRLGENGSLDWKTSFSTKFERLQIDDDTDQSSTTRIANGFANPVEDEWKIRSQLNYFPWNRIFAFYSAAEYIGQYQARFGSLQIGSASYFFPQLRKREFNLEWGVLLTDAKQNAKLQIGFTRNRNLNWLRQIVIGDDDPSQGVSPDLFEDALKARSELPATDSELDVDLIRDRITQYGLAFSGEWSRDLYEWEDDGRKLTFSTKVSEGNFFGLPSQGNSSLPRFRMLWEGRITVPVVGNLAVAPGLEAYLLYLQQQPDSGSRLFVRWIPSVKLTYSFDVKPLFQRFWTRGLWFKNK